MGIIINPPEYNNKFFDNEDDLLNKEYLVKREDDEYSRSDSRSSSSDSSRYGSDSDSSRSNHSSSDSDRSSSHSSSSSYDDRYSNDHSSSYYNNDNDYDSSRSGRKNDDEDLQRAPVSQTDFIGYEGEEKPLDQLQQKEESKSNTFFSNKYIKFGSIGIVSVIALFILVRFIVKHRKKNDLSKNFSKNYSKARDIIQHPDADNSSFDSRTSASLYRMESADSIVNMNMFHTADVTYERANSNRNITPIVTNNISSKMSKVSPITFANLMNNQQASSPVDGDITLDSPYSLQNIQLPSSTGSTISLSSEESKSTLARSKGAVQKSSPKFKPHRRSKFISSRSKSLVNTSYYMPPDFCMTPRITKKIPGLDQSPVPTDDELEYPPTPLPDSLDDIPFSDNPDIDSEDTDAASSIIEPLDEIQQEHELQKDREEEMKAQAIREQEIREQEIRAKTIRERAIREQAIKEQEIREQKIRAKDIKPLEIKTKEINIKKSKQKSKNRLSQSSIQRQPSPLQKESSQIIEDRQYYQNSPLKQEFSPEAMIPISSPAIKNIYNPIISPSPNHQQSDVQTNILHSRVYSSSVNNKSSPVPSQLSHYSIAQENAQITQSPLQRKPPPLKIQSSKSKITIEDFQMSSPKQKGVHQRQTSHLSQSSKSKVNHHRQPSQPTHLSKSKANHERCISQPSQTSIQKVSHQREPSQLSQSSITMVDYEPEQSRLSQSTITMVNYEEDITQTNSSKPIKSSVQEHMVVQPVTKQSKQSSGKIKAHKNKNKNKNKKESRQVKPPPPKPNPRKSSRIDKSAFEVEDPNRSKVNVINVNHLEQQRTSEMSFEEEMMASFDKYNNNITDNFNMYNGNSSHILSNNQII